MSENFFKDSDRNDARLCLWLGFASPFLGLMLAAIRGAQQSQSGNAE